MGLDSVFLKQLGIVGRKCGDLTKPVVHHADIDPFLCFADKDLEDGSPHLAFLNDKVLHEDELLCFLKFLKHCRELVFAQREEFH